MPRFSSNDTFYLIFLVNAFLSVLSLSAQELNNSKVDGYKGIWFELNQKYEYGDKYSGALGTYTAKHKPLAIYVKKVDKTFFVYGGTTNEAERQLLCMIGVYDHKSGLVSKPTVVFDKEEVDDPHDNPSLLIDNKGFLWVFVSGRGQKRPGFKYKSEKPYSIDSFVQVTKEEMTYPQPKLTQAGMFNFFTKYTGVRQLYYEKSEEGAHWSQDRLLAAIADTTVGPKSGHYQVSAVHNGKKVGTFFNRHPNGNVDKRTDLYYLESSDFGESWQSVKREGVALPLLELNSTTRAVNYAEQGKNVYLKDMSFTDDGFPICLYIRSNGHEPGPQSAPYEWCITFWTGKKWKTDVITTSDHNYDMGSLFVGARSWRVVGPTEKGGQEWGVGGELAIWEKNKQGRKWKKVRELTHDSEFSHSYVRKSLNHKTPFCFFWSSGDSHNFSKCKLYFGDFEGRVWELPYNMTEDYEKPIRIIE